MHLVEALFNHRYMPKEGPRDALASLLRRAWAAEQERNRLIHSSWTPIGDDVRAPLTKPAKVFRVRTHAKGKRRTEVEEVDAAKIEKLATDIAQLGGDFFMFALTLPKPTLERLEGSRLRRRS